MADDNFTLTTFYTSWKAYQDRLAAALAPLTAEQLALRPAPGLRSIGENAAHIIGCRVGWFTYTLREEASADLKDVDWEAPGGPSTSAADLVRCLDLSWHLMADCLARWSDMDMRQTFPDEAPDGTITEVSRAWVVWHVLEHDLHHAGEISMTLGMHGVDVEFTS